MVQADEVDVFVFQPGAKQRSADHREGNLHQVGVDIDGADAGLSVEIPQRLGEGVLHDRGQNFELLSIETLLDEAPLRAPGFPVGGEKTLAQEVAHPLHLNFGFVVVLRIGLQHVLNDGGIGGYDGLFDAAKIEPEGVAVEFGVLRQNLHGIAGHRARIHEGAEIGKRRVRFAARSRLAIQAQCEPTAGNMPWSPECRSHVIWIKFRCLAFPIASKVSDDADRPLMVGCCR
jgi:hypothetical protein